MIGFVGSAFLVIAVLLSSPPPTAHRGIYDRTMRGIWIYLATPRLRGLLSLNLAAAAAGAMVSVNTVFLVRSDLGLGDAHVAIALGAFGGGSMLAALLLRRLLDNYYLPGDLERQIGAFVEYDNNQRYHESLNNGTPADFYVGRDKAILRER
ncbi:ISCc3, transposase OrfB [Sulfitobacter guttiformis KCTC 32187]|nr:ISCc3, transposase OrfB [Sulfitobacter guttiformis KCTC 32187]